MTHDTGDGERVLLEDAKNEIGALKARIAQLKSALKQPVPIKPNEVTQEGFYWVHAPTVISLDWQVVKVEFSSLDGGLCVYDATSDCHGAPPISTFPDTARFVGPLIKPPAPIVKPQKTPRP